MPYNNVFHMNNITNLILEVLFLLLIANFIVKSIFKTDVFLKILEYIDNVIVSTRVKYSDELLRALFNLRQQFLLGKEVK